MMMTWWLFSLHVIYFCIRTDFRCGLKPRLKQFPVLYIALLLLVLCTGGYTENSLGELKLMPYYISDAVAFMLCMLLLVWRIPFEKRKKKRGNRNDEVDTFLFSFQLSCTGFLALRTLYSFFFCFSVERIRENVTTAATWRCWNSSSFPPIETAPDGWCER